MQSINEGFNVLPAQIPEIKHYQFGPDLGFNKNNADYVVIGDFESEADFKHYVTHPAHLEFVKREILPVIDSYQSLQFKI